MNFILKKSLFVLMASLFTFANFNVLYAEGLNKVKINTLKGTTKSQSKAIESDQNEVAAAQELSSADNSSADNSPADDTPLPEASAECEVCDPLEHFNRSMFTFNDTLDVYFLKPIATLYNKIIPKPLNTGIHNAFDNIHSITTIANDLLQLHIGQALNDTWRFAINTTVGVGGLFDIGERIGLAPYTNDFGLTMARWGWCNSTYVVLPFWGPNTIRDTIRLPVDYYAFSIWPYIYPYSTRYGLYGLSVIDNRAQLLKFQCVLEEVSFDQYVFMRSAYMQRRSFQIEENLALGFTGRINACPSATATVNDSSADSLPAKESS